MFKKAIDSFQNLDLFSQKVELFMKKEKDHKTTFGACSSIALLLIMFYFGLQMFSEMVTKSNPNTQQFIYYNPVPDRYDLVSRNFTFVFQMENGTSYQTFLNESLFSAAVFATHKHIVQDADGATNVVFDTTEVPITVCSMSKIGVEELDKYFETYDMATSYCLDFDEIDKIMLQGAYDSPNFRYIELQIRMCSNDTLKPGQDHCAPQEEIDRMLETVIFAWQLSDVTIDLSDTYSPHKVVGKDIYTTATNKMFKHVDMYFQSVETSTDYGYLTTDIENVASLKYSDHVEQTQPKLLGNMFFRMMFRLKYEEQQNTRQYLKIADILGNLGGIWQILYFLFLIFVAPINQLSQKLILLNTLFNFEGQEEVGDDDFSRSYQKSTTLNNIKATTLKKSIHANQLKQPTELNASKKLQGVANSIKKLNSLKKPADKQQSIDSVQILEKKESINTAVDQDRSKHVKLLSMQIKKYFKETQRRLVLSCYDYFQLVCSCCKLSEKNIIKKEQIKFSDQRIEKSMDIINIIQKLNEIDKLKVLLLSNDQIRLFDYVEKPTISINPYQPMHEKQHQKYWSVLKPDKSHYQSAIDAQLAFNKIHKDNNATNKRLVEMLDKNVIKLFKSLETEDNFIVSGEEIADSDCEYKIEDEEKYCDDRQSRDPHYTDFQPNTNNIVSPRNLGSDIIISVNEQHF